MRYINTLIQHARSTDTASETVMVSMMKYGIHVGNDTTWIKWTENHGRQNRKRGLETETQNIILRTYAAFIYAYYDI